MGWSNVRCRDFAVGLGRSLFAAVLLLCVAGRVPVSAQAGPPTAAGVNAAKNKADETLKASKKAAEAARVYKAKTAEDKANKAVEMAKTAKEAAVKDANVAAEEVKKQPGSEANKQAAETTAEEVLKATQKVLDEEAALAKLKANHAADESKAMEANISSPKAAPEAVAPQPQKKAKAVLGPAPAGVVAASPTLLQGQLTTTAAPATAIAAAAATILAPEADAVFVILAAWPAPQYLNHVV